MPPKRKTPSSSTNNNPPSKSRRSNRSSKSTIDQTAMLKFLLSPQSLPLSRPQEESDFLSSHPDHKSYSGSSQMTPFEELLCALILSRPIGHRLGLRSIRTLFNAPYIYTSPRVIIDAGKDKMREALDEARTQHRQKTADEIFLLAEAVNKDFSDSKDGTSLDKLREICGKDSKKEGDMLKKNIKGMGKTGIDIFGRRVQGAWAEWYPCADEKTLSATESLGLGKTVDAVVKCIDQNWSSIKGSVEEGKGDEVKKRYAFVRVLERAIGIALEGREDEARQAIERESGKSAK